MPGENILTKGEALVRHITTKDENELEELLNDILLNCTESTSIGFLNQHGFNLAMTSSKTYQSFIKMSYLFRDGIGMKIACKRFGISPRANLNGTDLIPRLVKKMISLEKFDFYCFGTQQPWLNIGVTKLFGNTKVVVMDGFMEETQYLKTLSEGQNGRQKVILLAMGMPKQESVAEKILSSVDATCIVICGGAIIDFKANRFKRAPKLMRKFALEWLFRLMSEPNRLFKRYVFGIPLFFYYLVKN